MGSVASMASVTIGLCLAVFRLPLLPSLLAGLAVGAILGLINGVFVFYFKLPSFITTFGMATSLSGLARQLTRSTPIELTGTPNFDWIGRGFAGPIPIPIIIAVIGFVILYVVLQNTCFGRTVKAIGSNRKVSLLSGRRVTMAGITSYVLSGFLVALTSIMMSSRIYCAHPDLAPNLAFDAIAAAVGGVSMQGEKGTGQPTIRLIIVSLLNGLTLVNVSTYMQMVTRGTIIILAIIVNNLRSDGFSAVTGIRIQRNKAGVQV